MALWKRHSLDGVFPFAAHLPEASTKTTSVLASIASAGMPDAVMSIPSFQRTEILPERPGLKPSACIFRAAATMASRMAPLRCCGIAGHLRVKRAQAFAARRRNPALGHEAGDEPRRRHIESGVGGMAARRGDLHRYDLAAFGKTRHMRDLAGAALLDRNIAHAIRDRPVDG